MYRRSENSESSVQSRTAIDLNSDIGPETNATHASIDGVSHAVEKMDTKSQSENWHLNRTGTRDVPFPARESDAEKSGMHAKSRRGGRSASPLRRGSVFIVVCIIFGLIMLGAGVYAASSISSGTPGLSEESSADSETAANETLTAAASGMSGGAARIVSESKKTGTVSSEKKSETSKEVSSPASSSEAVKNVEPEKTVETKPEGKYTVQFVFWDRDTIVAKTDGGTVRSILAENGYTLDSLHVPSIGADDWVDYDVTVNVLTLSYETVNVTEEIPFGTDYVYSDSLPSGQSMETTAGSVGYRNVMYTVEYINGEENYRSCDSEYITSYPVNQVITVGTAPSTVVETDTGGVIYGSDGTAYHYSKVITVKATYYNLLGGTASGLPVGDGIIATDPSVIPLGTSVYLKNDAMDLGVRVAADTGVYGAWVDVWMNESSPFYSIFAPTGVWEMTCYILD